MSDNINPSLVEEACMADLSRIRQEELPLETRSRRGPTFTPCGRNSTDHISKEVKNSLNAKWSVEINDEETEQLEGLEVEDARPWAKKYAKMILEDQKFNASLPDFQKMGNPFKNAKHTHFRPSEAKASLVPGTITFKEVAPGWKAQVASMQRSTAAAQARSGTPLPKQASTPSRPVPVSVTQNNSTPVTVTKQGLGVPIQDPWDTLGESKPSVEMQNHQLKRRASLGGTEEPSIYHGPCHVMQEGGEQFNGTITIKMNLKSNQAFMALAAPGKGSRQQEVIYLKTPVVVYRQVLALEFQSTPPCKYVLKLDNEAEAQKLKSYMETLHKAALAHKTTEPDTEKPVQSPSSSTLTETSVSIPTVVHDSPQSSTTPTPNTPAISSSQGEHDTTNQLIKLAEISDEPSSMPLQSMDTIASHLVNLTDRILRTITIEGQMLGSKSGAIIQGIEDAAIEYWEKQGFMKGLDDDVRENLLEILRNLVEIRSKLNKRFSTTLCLTPTTNEPGEASRALMDSFSKRIQYSPAELEQFRGLRSPRPKEIEATTFLPKSRASAEQTAQRSQSSSTPRRLPDVCSQIPRVTQQMAWLTAKSCPEDASPREPSPRESSTKEPSPKERSRQKQMVDDDLDTSMADADSIMSHEPEVAPSSTTSLNGSKKPPRKGLSHSKWANVEESSHFCGSESSFDGSEPPRSSSEDISPAEVPAGHNLKKPGVKGLSASRYATKPATFEGQFTGAS